MRPDQARTGLWPRAKVWTFVVCALLIPCSGMRAQTLPWSQRVADQTIARWPAAEFRALEPPSWNYQLGLLLQGVDAVWEKTQDQKYFAYTQNAMDRLVDDAGKVATYDAKENSLDNILLGRQLLLLYRVTHQEKYRKAALLLREQLAQQPRNASGGFWHTQSNPDQMLLDDEYMVAPFLAEYAATFAEPQDFAEVTKQFVLLDEHTRDRRTGLLYQEWNEPRTEPWVNKVTGASASFWGRGTGWYLMALVDALPYYPGGDPARHTLLEMLSRTAAAIRAQQDRKTGLWYLVLDKPGEKGNYLESSAAGMFVYVLAKAVRLGYLPGSYLDTARNGWNGMLKNLLKTDPRGEITIVATVKGIDLGSAPSHDGSYSYYVHAPVVENDVKGIGAFLLAATEMERAEGARTRAARAGKAD